MEIQKIVEISMTQNYKVILDYEDYDKIKIYNWIPQKSGTSKKIYASCKPENNKTILMHRLILGIDDNTYVDHINYNGLDNRKSNLRLCSHSQNLIHAEKMRRKWNCKSQYPQSKYKGVSWQNHISKWRARISTEYIGVFNNQEDAAKAYNKRAKEIYGDFAVLNFPLKDSTDSLIKV